MDKRRILGVTLLLAAAAAVVTVNGRFEAAQQAEEAAYQAYLDTLPVAQVEGEVLSPDGRFRAETAGESDIFASGVRVPETLRIVDTGTGEVLWEDTGYLSQKVLWSPEGELVAIAYGGRAWEAVKILETDTWTAWDFTLPDGSAIPEYTFLSEDWGQWLSGNDLLVTVGEGDGAEQHTYRCSLWPDENGALTGSALEQTTEVLRGSYDFDWDGASETVEVVTVLDPEAGAPPAWYELRVTDGGEALWSATAGLSHAGWRSFFACTVDGADCLLTYDPAMYQGGAGYAYELLSLEGGGLTLLRQGSVQFDVNFGSPSHDSFDADTIAAFLEEVHGYLDTATLLLSTEGGVYVSGGSGADFRGDDFSGTLYDTPGTWYQRVREAEAALIG